METHTHTHTHTHTDTHTHTYLAVGHAENTSIFCRLEFDDIVGTPAEIDSVATGR